MKSFPEQLIVARKIKGMTQEQLAEKMNVSRSMISHWERGRALPDVESLRRLSQILGYNFLQEEALDFTVQTETSETSNSAASDDNAPRKKSNRTVLIGFLAGTIVTALVALFILLPILSEKNIAPPSAEETITPMYTVTAENAVTPEETVALESSIRPQGTAAVENTATSRSTATPESAVTQVNAFAPKITSTPTSTTTPETSATPKNTVTPANTVEVAILTTQKPYTPVYGSPAWFKQPNERAPGQAYLSITTPENPLKATRTGDRGTGTEWSFVFYLEEQNGIDFTVEDYTLTMFYTETRTFVDKFGAAALKSRWGSNTIPAGRQQMISGALPQQPMEGIGVVFSGVDANGNQLEFRYYLALSREIAQSTLVREEKTAAGDTIADMLTWCKQPNERVEGQAYVNIFSTETPLKLIESDLFANGFGWQYSFYLQEEHGIDFTVDEITEVRFFTERNADIMKFTPLDVWGYDVLLGKGPTSHHGGAFHAFDNMLGIGLMITGTDVDGNELEFHHFLELSHEVSD